MKLHASAFSIFLVFVFFSYQGATGQVLVDGVYKDEIRSIQFQGLDQEEPYPIIRMGSEDQLTLKFDELTDEATDYQFTVIHCNYNWEPSGLLTNQYLDGMFNDYITDYNTSFNTFVNYFHYQAQFPNFNMKPILPGNYVLKVYADSDPENVILTRRFFVVSYAANISSTARRATLATYMYTHQEIDFEVDITGLNSFNPRSDFKVLIRQNNRWDNAKFDLEPLFIRENKLIYNYEKENVFEGGNEFRAFETRNIRFGGQNVYKQFQDSASVFNAILYAEKPRDEMPYASFRELNGHYVIQSQETRDDDTESDYVWVHFFLQSTYKYAEDVYVFGGLSNWKLDKRFKMKYDSRKRLYKAKVLLKQGYYNYGYAVEKGGEPELTQIEGSQFEAENDYEIFVYQWSMDLNCDLLVGYRKTNSYWGEQRD